MTPLIAGVRSGGAGEAFRGVAPGPDVGRPVARQPHHHLNHEPHRRTSVIDFVTGGIVTGNLEGRNVHRAGFASLRGDCRQRRGDMLQGFPQTPFIDAFEVVFSDPKSLVKNHNLSIWQWVR